MQPSRLLPVALLLLLPATTLLGQFSLNAELRPRAEYRHGFSTLIAPQEDAAFFISQRTRLNLAFTNEQLAFFLSFQDVRVWGEVPQLNRSDVNSSVHQAWGELKLSPQVSLRLGRQELVYDNSRILGNVDWAQQGRSHDLALLRWNSGENSRLHAGFAFNQQSEMRVSTTYTLPNYKTMQFLWYNTRLENIGLSLLFLNNGIQFNQETTTFSQTMGGMFTSRTGGFDISASAYFQTGKDGTNRDLMAWYAAGQASFALNTDLNVAAGFEFLSGTDYIDVVSPEGTTNRSFTPLYGTNHAFNGHMDYFYVGNHINNVGLINPYISATYSLNRLSYTGVLHLFFTHRDVPATDFGQVMSPYLGTELDLIMGYTLSPEASIRLGYSHMFGSNTMEHLRGGSKDETNNWAWVMVVLKPLIFKSV